jgi:hypothetical protein
MPHIDAIQNIAKRHDGQIPPTWLSGDTEYQKAKVIAAVAHHDCKDAADPEFLVCDLAYQEKCIGIVESLMRGNMADDSVFAQAAARRWAEVSNPVEDLAR